MVVLEENAPPPPHLSVYRRVDAQSAEPDDHT